MSFSVRLPRFASSTVQSARLQALPVLDGRDVRIRNRWQLAPHTVALVGRPAVWSIVTIATPRIALGPLEIPAKTLTLEQDFGGHLFLIVVDSDGHEAMVIEAGPTNPNGTGALVPFAYPEDDFVDQGVLDFEPRPIAPPHGLDAAYFADLVRRTHRAYDGDQRYLAIEIPFLRVGRDSNSYVVGALLACGVDPRRLPRAEGTQRWEWTGYPGMEDPVHRANFGVYMGAPTELGEAVCEVAYHDRGGEVRYVVVGGEPRTTVALPAGTNATLDDDGRILFSASEARRHGLPSTQTDPPAQITTRRRFPSDPQPAGAEITLIIDGRSQPLAAGATYRGTITSRNDALGIVTMTAESGRRVVLPLVELGVELRDPARLDRLTRPGTKLLVGLRQDRHPRLRRLGFAGLGERFRPRRWHLPAPRHVALSAASIGTVALAIMVVVAARRAER